MTQQPLILLILTSSLLFIIFSFFELTMLLGKTECKHEHQATFDSYHKKVCIDCGEEFSTKDIKK